MFELGEAILDDVENRIAAMVTTSLAETWPSWLASLSDDYGSALDAVAGAGDDLDAVEARSFEGCQQLADRMAQLLVLNDQLRLLGDAVIGMMQTVIIQGMGGDEGVPGTADAHVAATLASATRLPLRTMKSRVGRAHYWNERIAAMVAEGVLRYAVAETIVIEAGAVAEDENLWTSMVDKGVEVAMTDRGSPAIVKREMRRHLAIVDPEIARYLYKKRRYVRLSRDDEGWARLIAVMPAAEAIEIMQALTHEASTSGETCAGEARAQALLQWSRRYASSESELIHEPQWFDRPRVNVTISVEALLASADKCAVIDGFGWVPSEVARALAADGSWSKWITRDGVTVHATPHTYRPTRALARTLKARYRSCVVPGCSTPSERCDLDHREPFDKGGRTELDNMAPLCRTHHNLKTHMRWRLEYDDDTGEHLWISPTGKAYVNPGVDPPAEVPPATWHDRVRDIPA